MVDMISFFSSTSSLMSSFSPSCTSMIFSTQRSTLEEPWLGFLGMSENTAVQLVASSRRESICWILDLIRMSRNRA